MKAVLQLAEVLTQPQLPGPFAPMDTSTLSALDHLSEIYSANIKAPALNKTPTAPPRVPIPPPPPPRVPIPATPQRVPKPQAPHRYPTRSSHRTLAVQSIIVYECVRFRSATQGIAPPIVDPTTHAAMINAIVDRTIAQLLEFRHIIADPKTRPTWMTPAANESSQLMDGLSRGNEGTNTMSFIRKTQVPKDRMVTYARFCCDYRPQKSERYQCRITVGGDRTDYEGDISTKTADLTTIKCLLNSVVVGMSGNLRLAVS
jgi:hypothetical protein